MSVSHSSLVVQTGATRAHYRDQGYGMGHRVGFISGMRGEQREVLPVGVTFPDDERNAALWKRWMGYLRMDMWMGFFIGAMIGMFLLLLPVHDRADHRHRRGAALLPADRADPLFGEHLQLRRAGVPIHADVHELAPAAGGPATLVGVPTCCWRTSYSLGFFFINFVFDQFTGNALVTF
jgi:hypothetical protein